MSTLAVLIALVALGWLLWKVRPGGKRTLRDVEIRAVDGETLELDGVDEEIRLARIDAPGKGQSGSERATETVRTILEEADHVRIEGSKRDEAGRHVAEVEVDGYSLSDLLLAQGVVRPSTEDGFIFPAETAKTFADEPAQRYRFSIQYLPLPAAFRHAAIGLREEIREKKRHDRSIEEPLQRIYRLACVQNVMLSGSLPGTWDEPMNPSVWDDLDFPYQHIGLKKLDLLGKRDQKRIREAWGEPQHHRSVQSGAPDVAQRFAKRLELSRS